MTIKKPILILFLTSFLISWILLSSGCAGPKNNDNEILIFASASLRNVMHEVAANYKQKTGVSVRFNFAGSNVLAKQIEASTQADIYLSANVHWVKYLSDRDLIHTSTKKVFLSNNLVIVAHKSSPWSISVPSELAELPFKYLSLGDPNAVPAGSYARAYLKSVYSNSSAQKETVWASVKDRVLPAPDVRAAASIVEDMEGIIGIVYKTDAIVSNQLKILHEITYEPGSTLERVKYVAAGIRKEIGKNETFPKYSDVQKFLDYLIQDEAQTVFKGHGFESIFDSGIGHNEIKSEIKSETKNMTDNRESKKVG